MKAKSFMRQLLSVGAIAEKMLLFLLIAFLPRNGSYLICGSRKFFQKSLSGFFGSLIYTGGKKHKGDDADG